jgi:hypothetical protein
VLIPLSSSLADLKIADERHVTHVQHHVQVRCSLAIAIPAPLTPCAAHQGH